VNFGPKDRGLLAGRGIQKYGVTVENKGDRPKPVPFGVQINLVIFLVSATAAAITTIATTATAAATASVVGTGLGLVDFKLAAVDFLAVQGGHRLLSLAAAGHFDEPKTSGLTGIPVGDDLGALDLTKLGEQVLKVSFRGVEGKISHIQVH